MTPEPLEYERVPVARHSLEDGPRLSKLAVAGLVFALFATLQLCGCQLFAMPFRIAFRYTPMWLPLAALVVNVVALARILRAMDELRGEGLAISGIVVSFLTCVVLAVALA